MIIVRDIVDVKLVFEKQYVVNRGMLINQDDILAMVVSLRVWEMEII